MGITRIIVIFSLLFAISGFSGLIYESIWSHYLKLFLGHAAYAQTLVLAIFMGGMAIGSWLSGFSNTRWKNLLVVYAVVEAVIGIFALFFHETFTVFLQIAYNNIMPSLESVTAVQFFKWLAASLLIFPQSVLLGMTFPLMTSGLLRIAPLIKGRVVSTLYFSNSIGASVGVLVGGFLLIDWFGLPGTIKIAGILNTLVAVFVVLLVKKLNTLSKPTDSEKTFKNENSLDIAGRRHVFFLVMAFATGLASFIYEISWIRMLSLVLGSSTHAFELMLSAFILGLALGSFWLRRRIDKLKNEIRFLAYTQLLMGFFALITLPLYNSLFDIMQWVVQNSEKTDQGYFLFNVSSHLLALLVMLPATFCAGLTLPLITHILLGTGYGEKSVSHVYAVNTVGAIAGVVIAVHLLLPVVGLKNAVAIGAAIDIAAGVIIVARLTHARRSWDYLKNISPAIVAGFGVVILVGLVDFDSYKMASGVYRHGNLYTSENAELLFHKDGKTASVDLVRIKENNEISIITNGKPDASINANFNGIPSPDEATMVLLAGLPLSIKPDSNEAAVIGLGSGLTSHVLVSSNMLQRVDTIEIEPAIVEAARGFQPRVSSVYNNPISKIYIDDAKSFFSTRSKKYDLIISEPSNPWVSGVASLFTGEFYALVSKYLKANGLFVQWLQLYEIDLPLVASVLKGIGQQFDDFAVYAANNNDVIIIAGNNESLGFPSAHIFRSPTLMRELARVRVRNVQDLQLRLIGDKSYLEPLIYSYDIPRNSDYYPVLDLKAIKARFLQRDAMKIITLVDDPVNSFSALNHRHEPLLQTSITPSRFYYPADLAYAAMIVRKYLLKNQIDRQFHILPDYLKESLMVLKEIMVNCNLATDESVIVKSLEQVETAIGPYLAQAELTAIWEKLKTSPCVDRFPATVSQKIDLDIATAESDLKEMARLSKALLASTIPSKEEVLFTGMIADLGQGKKQKARQLWETYGASVDVEEKSELLLRLLKTHADVTVQ